jgi:hypothetical protein
VKRLALAFLFAAVASSEAQINRIASTNEVGAGRSSLPMNIYRAQDLEYDLTLRQGGASYATTGNFFTVWYIADVVRGIQYLAKTGTIVSSGRVLHTMTREESNFGEGAYEQQVVLYRVIGGTNVQVGTAARSGLLVQWSANAANYPTNRGIVPTQQVFQVTVNGGGGGVSSWGDLQDIPAGFSDDIDNTNDTVEYSEIEGIVGNSSQQVARGDHGHADLAPLALVQSNAAADAARMDDLENQIASAGGDTSITNIINIDNSTHVTGMVGFVVVYTNVCCLPSTTNAGIVTYYENTNTGSGAGGIASINSSTNANHTLVGLYPMSITTIGGTSFVGLVSSDGGLLVIPPWTNVQEVTYDGPTSQLYVVGAGVTQLFVEGWSASVGNSPGGYGRDYIDVTPSEVLTLDIPQGGLCKTNAVATGGWPDGGSSTSTNGLFAISAAGSVRIFRGTNPVFIVSGAAGGYTTTTRGPGGGLIGYSFGTTQSGSPGTQTNGGAPATSYPGATTGAYLTAGNGTPAGGAYPGAGGSGGLYGAGGSAGAINTLQFGACGSSLVSARGYTSRSATDTANPPATDSPNYKSPWGVATASVTNNARGNPGALVITRP